MDGMNAVSIGRLQMGLPLMEYYRSIENAGTITGAAPRMLDQNNNPIHPTWVPQVGKIKLSEMKVMYIFLVYLTSCTVTKQTVKVKFNYFSGLQQQKVVISIPKGSKLIRITAGGEGEEHRYLFSDSSVIYLSDMTGSATLNTSKFNLDPPASFMELTADTLSHAEIDNQGYYWKEIKKGYLRFGYAHISHIRKNDFDKAITSLRCKKCR